MIIYVIRHQKVFTSFLLILIFNELFTFKTSDEWQRWKTGSSTLDWKDINLLFTQSLRSLCFLYSVAATFRQKIACNVIWFYVNYIEHVKFFENNITSLQDKPTEVTIENTLFSRKLSSLDPIYTHTHIQYIYIYVKYSARRQVRPSTCTTRVVD